MTKISFSVFEEFLKNSFLEFLPNEDIKTLYENMSQFEVENNQRVPREEQPQFLYFCFRGKVIQRNRIHGFEVAQIKAGQSLDFKALLLRSGAWPTDWIADGSVSILKIPWSKFETVLTKYPLQVSYLTKLAQSPSLQRLKRDLLALGFTGDFAFNLISRLVLMPGQTFLQMAQQGQLTGSLFLNVANGDLDVVYGPEVFRKRRFQIRTGQSLYFSHFVPSPDNSFHFYAETRIFVLSAKDVTAIKALPEFSKFDSTFSKRYEFIANGTSGDLLSESTGASVSKSYMPSKFEDTKIWTRVSSWNQESKARHSNLWNELKGFFRNFRYGEAPIANQRYDQKTAILQCLFEYFNSDFKPYELYSRDKFFSTDLRLKDFEYELGRFGFKTKLISNLNGYDVRQDRWYVAEYQKTLCLFRYINNDNIRVLDTESGTFQEVIDETFFNLVDQNNVIEIGGFNKDVAQKKRAIRYVQYFKLQKLHHLILDQKTLIWTFFACGVWTYVFSLSIPIATQYMLDQVIQTGRVEKLLSVGGFLVVLALLSTYFDGIQQKWSSYLSAVLGTRIRGILHKNLFEQNRKKDLRIPPSTLLSRLNESELLASTYVNQILPMLTSVLLILVTLSVVFMYSPLISTLFAISLPAFCLLIYLRRDQIRNLKNSYFRAKDQELRALTDAYHRHEPSLNHQQNIFARWKIDAHLESFAKFMKISSLNQSVLQALQIAKSEVLRIVTFLVSMGLYSTGELALGQVLALTMLAPRFGSLTQAIINGYYQIFNLEAGLDRLNELMSEPMGRDRDADFAFTKVSIEDGVVGLTADNLAFADEQQRVIIKNISFKLERGNQMVLVGPDLLAKETLIRIIVGAENGFLGQFVRSNAFYKTALVNSDLGLFTGSLVYNLTLEESSPDLNRLNNIITVLGFESELLGRQDGLNYHVHGLTNQFSASDIKRILLVRALYQEPDVLVCQNMDDYFDIQTEHEVFKAVKKLMTKGIVIWESKSFSIATKASHVLYVSDREGTTVVSHLELLEQSQEYKDFFVQKLSINI